MCAFSPFFSPFCSAHATPVVHQLAELFFQMQCADNAAITPTLELAKLALVSHRDEEDEDDEMFPQPEGDAEGGYSYHGPAGRSAASVPLISNQSTLDDENVVFDGDEELSHIQQNGGQNGAAAGETELVPYAHRDLKPGCVVLFLLRSS